MLMNICKLYDRSKGSISVYSLLKVIRKSAKLKKAEATVFEQAAIQVEPLISKVNALRNKYFAHQEKNKEYEQLLKEVGIRYDDFKDILDQTLELLNQIANFLHIDTHGFPWSAQKDTRRLLNDLKNAPLTKSSED